MEYSSSKYRNTRPRLASHTSATGHSGHTAPRGPVGAQSNDLTVTIGESQSRTHSHPNVLPNELLLEVISYMQADPFDREVAKAPGQPQGCIPNAVHRQDAIRAMSQTSSGWRRLYQPFAWESLDLAGLTPNGGRWNEQILGRLLWASKALTTSPQLGSYVKNIRISMRKSDMHITVPALREALDSCPNIKVVSIFRAEAAKATTDLFKSYFNDRSYFSIETVMVPKSARGLLQACPNIKKLIWSGRGGPELFQTLAHIPTGTHRDIGSSLIVFVGLPEIDHTIINWEKLSRAAPNLQEVEFAPKNDVPTYADLAIFGHFNNLRRLVVRVLGSEADVHAAMQPISQELYRNKILLKCALIVKPYVDPDTGDGRPCLRLPADWTPNWGPRTYCVQPGLDLAQLR